MAQSLPAVPSRCAPILAGVILALGLGLAASSAAETEVKLSQTQTQSLGVRVAHPTLSRTDQTLAFPAQIVIPTPQLWVASAPVAGMVSSVSVARGDQVKAGQPLMTLESPSFVSLQREYLHAVQQEVLVAQQLRRNSELFKGNAVPWRVVEASQTEARQASLAAAERRQMLRLSGMSDASVSRLTDEAAITAALSVNAPEAGTVVEIAIALASGSRAIGPAPEARTAVDPMGGDCRPGIRRARHPARRAGRCRGLRHARPGRAGLGDGRCGDANRAGPRRSAELGRAASRADRCGANWLFSPGEAAWGISYSALIRRGEASSVFVAIEGGFRLVPVTLVAEDQDHVVVSGAISDKDALAISGVSALRGILQGLGTAE